MTAKPDIDCVLYIRLRDSEAAKEFVEKYKELKASTTLWIEGEEQIE